MASFNGIVCPLSTECLLTGRTTTAPFVLYGATTASTSVTFAADTLPTGVGSLAQMACPSSTACVLIGLTTASAPTILSGAITGPTTPDTWTSVTVPPPPAGDAITQLSQVNCWSSPMCAITAIGTNASGQPMAFLLGSSGSTTTWTAAALPTANPALYLSGVVCVSPGTGTCTAVGAGAEGAVELASTSGPTGAWSDQTASLLASQSSTQQSGVNTTGIPVEINNANLQPSVYQTLITPGWTTSPTTPLPPLFPFFSGYAMFAGDCSTESITGLNVAQATTVPGSSSTTTIPLSLFSVQVLHASGTSVGLPYAATLSLTSTAASPCGADTYPLQAAGVDGLSRTEVPYGTYTLSITTAGGTTTVSSVTVGGSSVTVGVDKLRAPESNHRKGDVMIVPRAPGDSNESCRQTSMPHP